MWQYPFLRPVSSKIMFFFPTIGNVCINLAPPIAALHYGKTGGSEERCLSLFDRWIRLKSSCISTGRSKACGNVAVSSEWHPLLYRLECPPPPTHTHLDRWTQSLHLRILTRCSQQWSSVTRCRLWHGTSLPANRQCSLHKTTSVSCANDQYWQNKSFMLAAQIVNICSTIYNINCTTWMLAAQIMNVSCASHQ